MFSIYLQRSVYSKGFVVIYIKKGFLSFFTGTTSTDLEKERVGNHERIKNILISSQACGTVL